MAGSPAPSAVVTGAARGFGKEIARRLVARGHRVLITDVDAGAVAQLGPVLARLRARSERRRWPRRDAAALRSRRTHTVGGSRTSRAVRVDLARCACAPDRCAPGPPVSRTPRRHDADAGGDPELLAAKAALREEVWTALTEARVARFPGARTGSPTSSAPRPPPSGCAPPRSGRAAATLKSNPDSAQLPVRQRALEDGRTVYMAVPRLAEPEPFFLLDPAHLADPPRKAASIAGASRSARRVAVAELEPVDLVVTGCVAVGADGARLGKGGGFADLEFALATAAGLIGPATLVVTTVHELQVRPAGRSRRPRTTPPSTWSSPPSG